MSKILYEMPIPSVNHSYIPIRRKDGKLGIAKKKQTNSYSEGLGWIAKEKFKTASIVDIHMIIDFYIKNMSRDIDNMLKAVLDGLINIVYIDDRQVKQILVNKYKSDKDRVEIEIVEVS